MCGFMIATIIARYLSVPVVIYCTRNMDGIAVSRTFGILGRGNRKEGTANVSPKYVHSWRWW